MEVVLSEVDPRGDLKSNSGFCFPAQIAHGAVLDLAQRGLDLVFLPHVMRMPQPNACRDSYLCPITQAGPYFLAKAFPEIRFLSPLLDFTNGYAASSALVEMAVRDLGTPRLLAEQAWTASVNAQTEAESALRELGQRALERAVAEGKPAILLAGPATTLSRRKRRNRWAKNCPTRASRLSRLTASRPWEQVRPRGISRTKS